MEEIFLFLFGLAVGSFLNCLVYRVNNNLSLLRGRSICPKCKHRLAWYDNIPLLSFILLGGKCRYCHKPISWQYPLVELAAGILTLLVFNLSKVENSLVIEIAFFNLIPTYALLGIFVSDLIYGTIPDEIIYSTIFLGLIFLIFHSPTLLSPKVLAGIFSAGFFYFLVLLTKGKGMGMGDVKLAGLMGLFLGWPNIVLALYLAFLTGAFFGVILILLKRKKMGQTIPFGPFLSVATFITIFWGEQLLNIFKKCLGF